MQKGCDVYEETPAHCLCACKGFSAHVKGSLRILGVLCACSGLIMDARTHCAWERYTAHVRGITLRTEVSLRMFKVYCACVRFTGHVKSSQVTVFGEKRGSLWMLGSLRKLRVHYRMYLSIYGSKTQMWGSEHKGSVYDHV